MTSVTDTYNSQIQFVAALYLGQHSQNGFDSDNLKKKYNSLLQLHV